MKGLVAIAALGLVIHASAQGPSLGAPSKIVITKTGASTDDPSSALCSDFRLSVKQVARFFNHAVIVTNREIHDYYSVCPCFVQGSAEFRGVPATWEIRACGTATIALWSGDTFQVVDEQQRDKPH